MRLSLYTFVRDGLYFDFHVVPMLRHHLPLADEIIVNEGYSNDGTYEAISDIDPKVKVFRHHWDRSDPRTWSLKFKNQAREHCTGDWCILLDCDEFIPEWEFDRIREHLLHTPHDIVSLRHRHFYGNYRVFHTAPERVGWPVKKNQIHRNREDMQVWGDGSNVRPGSGETTTTYDPESFECHHFGFVRNPARLRHKWRIQAKRNGHSGKETGTWDRTPGVLFNLRPHQWDDPKFFDDLAVYEGPFVKAVQDDPDEFVRDDLTLLDKLQKRAPH